MLEEMQQRLGYCFKDASLLETALTHPSYGSDRHVPDNQRLEFLGDAVLELAVSRLLYMLHPDMPEGGLSRLRSALVREETLAQAAAGYQIGKEIRLSVGEERTGGRRKPSLLADAMEAVIAAVYLDGGTEAAFDLVERTIDVRASVDLDYFAMDSKTRLQELLQKDGHAPSYEIVSMEGPPHAPTFTAHVSVDGQLLGKGQGRTKRQAQQQAAAQAISLLSGPKASE
ncbi:MAG: ribonuclease III [Eubacteriales bacterium]|nr:ribonuclease III [Eubacteriales bacterium]